MQFDPPDQKKRKKKNKEKENTDRVGKKCREPKFAVQTTKMTRKHH
jgi:hypothetical protein